jgi:hypothetical protein
MYLRHVNKRVLVNWQLQEASMKLKLQVGLISTRRPDLIRRTLTSFNEKLFTNFQIEKVFVNVDPAFGGKPEHQKSIEVIREILPDAVIREPKIASFGAAVKWVWSKFDDGLALHLEDDWELKVPIYPEDVETQLNSGFSAITLCGNSRIWYKQRKYLWLPRKRKKFPFIGSEKVPALGTQPKFIKGDFARKISDLLDPNLDPEKQMLPEMNPSFSEIIKFNRCGFLKKSGNKQYGVMNELGREWRDARKIKKVLENGKSSWIDIVE